MKKRKAVSSPDSPNKKIKSEQVEADFTTLLKIINECKEALQDLRKVQSKKRIDTLSNLLENQVIKQVNSIVKKFNQNFIMACIGKRGSQKSSFLNGLLCGPNTKGVLPAGESSSPITMFPVYCFRDDKECVVEFQMTNFEEFEIAAREYIGRNPENKKESDFKTIHERVCTYKRRWNFVESDKKKLFNEMRSVLLKTGLLRDMHQLAIKSITIKGPFNIDKRVVLVDTPGLEDYLKVFSQKIIEERISEVVKKSDVLILTSSRIPIPEDILYVLKLFDINSPDQMPILSIAHGTSDEEVILEEIKSISELKEKCKAAENELHNTLEVAMYNSTIFKTARHLTRAEIISKLGNKLILFPRKTMILNPSAKKLLFDHAIANVIENHMVNVIRTLSHYVYMAFSLSKDQQMEKKKALDLWKTAMSESNGIYKKDVKENTKLQIPDVKFKYFRKQIKGFVEDCIKELSESNSSNFERSFSELESEVIGSETVILVEEIHQYINDKFVNSIAMNIPDYRNKVLKTSSTTKNSSDVTNALQQLFGLEWNKILNKADVVARVQEKLKNIKPKLSNLLRDQIKQIQSLEKQKEVISQYEYIDMFEKQVKESSSKISDMISGCLIKIIKQGIKKVLPQFQKLYLEFFVDTEEIKKAKQQHEEVFHQHKKILEDWKQFNHLYSTKYAPPPPPTNVITIHDRARFIQAIPSKEIVQELEKLPIRDGPKMKTESSKISKNNNVEDKVIYARYGEVQSDTFGIILEMNSKTEKLLKEYKEQLITWMNAFIFSSKGSKQYDGPKQDILAPIVVYSWYDSLDSFKKTRILQPREKFDGLKYLRIVVVIKSQLEEHRNYIQGEDIFLVLDVDDLCEPSFGLNASKFLMENFDFPFYFRCGQEVTGCSEFSFIRMKGTRCSFARYILWAQQVHASIIKEAFKKIEEYLTANRSAIVISLIRDSDFKKKDNLDEIVKKFTDDVNLQNYSIETIENYINLLPTDINIDGKKQKFEHRENLVKLLNIMQISIISPCIEQFNKVSIITRFPATFSIYSKTSKSHRHLILNNTRTQKGVIFGTGLKPIPSKIKKKQSFDARVCEFQSEFNTRMYMKSITLLAFSCTLN